MTVRVNEVATPHEMDIPLMFSQGFVNASYIASSVLFILSLSGLSNQESAKRGIIYGVVGMGIAIFATILGPRVTSYWLLIPVMAVASVVGWFVAKRVEMTQMPQLVAILHSFVGLAAVLVGFNSHFEASGLSRRRSGHPRH